MTADSNVEQEILQCIDDGLQILGDSCKEAINYYLEKNGLKKEEIAEKPETLQKGLSQIFGEEGACIVEKWIVQKLTMKFELKQESKLTLVEAITMIRTTQNRHHYVKDCK
jgi:hypothetical protein